MATKERARAVPGSIGLPVINIGNRSTEDIVVESTCWCEGSAVNVRLSEARAGQTRTCGLANCTPDGQVHP